MACGGSRSRTLAMVGLGKCIEQQYLSGLALLAEPDDRRGVGGQGELNFLARTHLTRS
jgi:hypothetical protein